MWKENGWFFIRATVYSLLKHIYCTYSTSVSIKRFVAVLYFHFTGIVHNIYLLSVFVPFLSFTFSNIYSSNIHPIVWYSCCHTRDADWTLWFIFCFVEQQFNRSFRWYLHFFTLFLFDKLQLICISFDSFFFSVSKSPVGDMISIVSFFFLLIYRKANWFCKLGPKPI